MVHWRMMSKVLTTNKNTLAPIFPHPYITLLHNHSRCVCLIQIITYINDQMIILFSSLLK